MYAKRKNTQKAVLVLLAVVLVIGCAIGGTIAYLQMKTDPVVNTFTSSNVSITLFEDDYNEDDNPLTNVFKMVPGATIPKNPTVEVTADSEDCYVFVKVEKSANFTKYMTYEMGTGWNQLKDANNVDIEGVFYREVKNEDTTRSFEVLKNSQVIVLDTVTKADMAKIDGVDEQDVIEEAAPELKFTAYAIQSANLKNGTTPITDAADAWALINK